MQATYQGALRSQSAVSTAARTVFAALFALAAFAHGARADEPWAFESSAPGNAGGGLAVSANLSGITFRVTERIEVSEVGAELNRLGSATHTVYAALYRVGTPVSTPDAVGEGGLLATALLTVDSTTPVDVAAPLSATLEPGWYSLVVGTGRHGATAPDFFATLNHTGQPTAPQTWGPYTVNATTNAFVLQGVNLRVFLHGHTLPPIAPSSSAFLAQTTLPDAGWGNGFWTIDANHPFAMRFSLARNTRVGRTSAWFYAGGSGSVFAAILRTASPTSTLPSPGSQAFADAVVASTLVPAGGASGEYAGVFNDVALAPGSYALVYGTGAYGANGTANPMALGDHVVGTGAWQWVGSTWFSGAKVRFALEGIIPQLEVAPDPADFGAVPLGLAATRTLTIRNVGDSTLHLGTVALAGADAALFAPGGDVSSCNGAELAPAASCAFSMTYTPTAVGSHAAQLVISSDGVPDPFVTPLSGTALASHTVTPVVDGPGTIAPDGAQIVAEGAQVPFTLVPQTGHHIAGVGGDCSGVLVGSVFTTAAVMNDCSVVAHFEIDTFIVTPASSGHGSIDPPGAQTVAYGGSAVFHLQPDSGYHVGGIGGDCPGDLDADTFTAGPIVAACSVVADFALDPPNAIAAVSGTPQSATVGGAFAAPLTVRVTNDGGLGVPGVSVAFAAPVGGASAAVAASAVTDTDGYASVDAIANGVVGSYAVTAAVDGVGAASFALENIAPDVALTLTIDDGIVHAAYGQTLDYTIIVHNDGSAVAADTAVVATLADALDATQASWICLDAGGGACSASGSGALDDLAVVPAHGSVTYLLSVPVRMDAAGSAVETAVQTSGAYDGYAASVGDTDVLVLFRDSFDAADLLADAAALAAGDILALPADAEPDAVDVHTVLAARAADGSGFRIDATPTANLRVVVIDAARRERASPWTTSSDGAPSIAFVVADGGVTLVVEGTQPPLAAALASSQTHWRVRRADRAVASAR
jgi:uncharacterized repeat protein (TIGR01451 family)